MEATIKDEIKVWRRRDQRLSLSMEAIERGRLLAKGLIVLQGARGETHVGISSLDSGNVMYKRHNPHLNWSPWVGIGGRKENSSEVGTKVAPLRGPRD